MSVEINQLTTEKRNPNTMHLDQMSVGQVLELMNKEDQQVPEVIAEHLDKLKRRLKRLFSR